MSSREDTENLLLGLQLFIQSFTHVLLDRLSKNREEEEEEENEQH